MQMTFQNANDFSVYANHNKHHDETTGIII